MDTNRMPSEGAMKRRFLLIFVAPLLLFPLLSLAMEHWVGISPLRRYHTNLLWTIAPLAAAVLLTYAITLRGEARVRREAGSKGLGAAQAAHLAFRSCRGTRYFMAVYAFMATNSAGWLWGTVFYGLCMLSLAEVMIRWHSYERAARAEQTG
jgi:hypothetical protein